MGLTNKIHYEHNHSQPILHLNAINAYIKHQRHKKKICNRNSTSFARNRTHSSWSNLVNKIPPKISSIAPKCPQIEKHKPTATDINTSPLRTTMVDRTESFDEDDGWISKSVGDGAWVDNDELGRRWEEWWMRDERTGLWSWVMVRGLVMDEQCVSFGDGAWTSVAVVRRMMNQQRWEFDEKDEREVRVWFVLRKGRSETAKEKR